MKEQMKKAKSAEADSARAGSKTKTMLQWHPAFYAGIQVEFEQEKDVLTFENEHQLGTKPKEIDVLIIKKTPDIPIEKNIGRIFREHNIVEYKSPTDYLSINDFYKVYGYACFYKSDGAPQKTISVRDITITFVCHNRPKKLLAHLKQERHFTIDRLEDGIYYINGDIFPIQMILTTELSDEKNLWLKNLTNRLTEIKAAEKLLTEYDKHKENNLYQSMMDIIIQANKQKFSEVKKMSVCAALEELMHDELEECRRQGMESGLNEGRELGMRQGVQEGMQQGIQQGVQQGIQQGVRFLIETCRELGVSKENTAQKLRTKYTFSEEETENYMQKYW